MCGAPPADVLTPLLSFPLCCALSVSPRFARCVSPPPQARHPNSFNVGSLAGIWAIPAVLAAANHFWRFIFLWLAFTAVAGQFLFKATRTPLDPETPRAAYKWFHYVYRASFALVLVGYDEIKRMMA